VLATAAEIASGMALLHSNGIIHGDLSAFNVMLSRYAVSYCTMILCSTVYLFKAQVACTCEFDTMFSKPCI
jgi:tRNA A-37 threonylcarbamoyl transferase component Bud32